jgi:hypothetical protein
LFSSFFFKALTGTAFRSTYSPVLFAVHHTYENLLTTHHISIKKANSLVTFDLPLKQYLKTQKLQL